MKNQTIDEIILEYGFRLSELENMFYGMTGVYPMYDCAEFWDDRAVQTTDCMLQLWWDLKNLRADQEAQ